MSHFVPLSKAQHKHSGLVAGGYEFALEKAVVPLAAEELPHVLPTMATAFVKAASGEEFELVALQSLQAGVNVYVHTNGQWIGGYRPAWYRAYPFRVLRDADTNKPLVCVDDEAPAFQNTADETAERLFDDQGEFTERMRNTVLFLEKVEQSRATTQALVKQLDDAGLIVPWNLNTRNPGGESGFEVKGVFHIDEGALRASSPERLGELATSGALSLAYSQLLSEHRLKGLTRLYEIRKLSEDREMPAEDVDLEDLFGEDDDGDLSFDL